MRKGDDLRALQMRVAGYRILPMLRRAGHQRILQAGECNQQIGAGAPRPHAQIRGHLVVAASPRVQHSGDGSRKLEKPAFDRGVNVLVARRNRESTRRKLGRDGA